MGNTNADGIWTPDEDDTMEPEVWSAMMGDSISGGLGKRMKLQETQISLRATAPDPFTVTATGASDAYMLVPLTIGGWTGSRSPNPDFAPGNHASGIDMAGGYAKILTPGLYTIMAAASFTSVGGDHSWDFFGKINGDYLGLPDYGVTSTLAYAGGRISDTRILAKGDTISLTVGVGTDHVGSIGVQDCLLTIALHYALPTEAIPGL